MSVEIYDYHGSGLEIVFKELEKRFAPVLESISGRLAFVLGQDDSRKRREPEIMFLREFTLKFWDLIMRGDYRLSSFQEHIKENNFSIDDDVLYKWANAGCLWWG